jgi:hypothetical protein
MANHHPDREKYPEWVIDVGNNIFHKTLTIIQRMLPTPENMAIIRGVLDALEFEYLEKRRFIDVEELIGADSTAVKKALKEKKEREANAIS